MLRIAIPTNRPQAVTNYLHALTMTGARGEAGRDFSADQYDGLLLPGGCDVNPARYGKEPIPQEITDDDQDALQFDVLARFLDWPEESWEDAIAASVPPKTLEINLRAFRAGMKG